MGEYFFLFLRFSLFGAELLLAVLLASLPLSRKPFFLLKLCGVVLAHLFAAAVAALLLFSNLVSENSLCVAFYALCAGVSVFWARLCFRGPYVVLLLCVSVGVTTVFLAEKLFALVQTLLLSLFAADLAAAGLAVHAAIAGGTFLAVYFSLVRTYGNDAEMYADKNSAWLGVFFLILSVFLLAAERFVADFQSEYFLILVGCESVYAIVMLFIDYALMKQIHSDNEFGILKRLWEHDRENYARQKENIELINIKCHDLRHQIRGIRRSGALSEKMIDEIEKAVDVYDSSIKTDNEVVDVILSDMSLRCRRNGIQFTCMVDGSQLLFMEDTDIYSLLGNMLENAFEYECKITPEEDRFISLVVKRAGEAVFVHAENYFVGQIELSGGMAKTTKKDKNLHGFGMLSMKRMTEKYGGKFDAYIADNMFQVETRFPRKGGETK